MSIGKHRRRRTHRKSGQDGQAKDQKHRGGTLFPRRGPSEHGALRFMHSNRCVLSSKSRNPCLRERGMALVRGLSQLDASLCEPEARQLRSPKRPESLTLPVQVRALIERECAMVACAELQQDEAPTTAFTFVSRLNAAFECWQVISLLRNVYLPLWDVADGAQEKVEACNMVRSKPTTLSWRKKPFRQGKEHSASATTQDCVCYLRIVFCTLDQYAWLSMPRRPHVPPTCHRLTCLAGAKAQHRAVPGQVQACGAPCRRVGARFGLLRLIPPISLLSILGAGKPHLTAVPLPLKHLARLRTFFQEAPGGHER